MGTAAKVSSRQTVQWQTLNPTAFLRDWLESCREAGKTGWDKMPWEWEPYLPDEGEIVIRPSSFLNAPTVIASVRELPPSVVQVIITSTAGAVTSIELGSTSATSNHRTSKPSTTLSTPVTSMVNATVLSTNTTSTLTAFGSTPDAPASSPSTVVTSHKLSSGAIGGIVAGFLALAALCAALGYFYWKSDKKAERKTREVAILSDRVSGCGFQKYIDDLLADSNSDSHRDDNTSTGTIVRHPASTSGAQQMPVGSTSVVDGV